ncbi:uncharacterized protein SCHCODRAFT_02462677, partial [Schizophyllum commune H4-8]
MCSYAGTCSGELYCCFGECGLGVSCLRATIPCTSARQDYKCTSTAFICRRGKRSQSARRGKRCGRGRIINR